jgi:hypothetical protein
MTAGMTAGKGNMWCGHEDITAGMTVWAEEWGRSRDLDIGEVGKEGSEREAGEEAAGA